jgi:hypothetical protein
MLQKCYLCDTEQYFFFQLVMQRLARRLEEGRTKCDTASSASSELQTGASVLQRPRTGGKKGRDGRLVTEGKKRSQERMTISDAIE